MAISVSKRSLCRLQMNIFLMHNNNSRERIGFQKFGGAHAGATRCTRRTRLLGKKVWEGESQKRISLPLQTEDVGFDKVEGGIGKREGGR